MGTREGVEKLPNGIDRKPPTKKQRDLICECITAVPESLMYPELKTYQEQETRYTAAEFLGAFIERNVDRIDGVKKIGQLLRGASGRRKARQARIVFADG